MFSFKIYRELKRRWIYGLKLFLQPMEYHPVLLNESSSLVFNISLSFFYNFAMYNLHTMKYTHSRLACQCILTFIFTHQHKRFPHHNHDGVHIGQSLVLSYTALSFLSPTIIPNTDLLSAMLGKRVSVCVWVGVHTCIFT